MNTFIRLIAGTLSWNTGHLHRLAPGVATEDKGAMDEFVRRTAVDLTRLVTDRLQRYPLVCATLQPDDVYVEAISRLLKAMKKTWFKHTRHFQAWATIEINHLLLDCNRRLERRGPTHPLHDQDEPTAPTQEPDAFLEAVERREALYQALNSLPANLQTVLKSSCLEDPPLTMPEIAKKLGVSLTSVKDWKTKALLLLKKKLGDWTPES